MARVKRGSVLKHRHRKILKYAKGFRGSNSRLFRAANQTVMKAWLSAYRDRRRRKRDFRRLWVARINSACRKHDLSYSRFIGALSRAGISLNRKTLAELAVADKPAFSALVELARSATAG